MAIIDASVGGVASNSYATAVEATTYFSERLPLTPPWEDADNPEAALIMATRVLDAMAMPGKTFIPASGGAPAHFRQRPQWTGAPASTTQRLAWPRTGMYDANGNAIASTVLPRALKEALAELAGQLVVADTTLDNDVSVKGITSIRAGSVSLSFKDSIAAKVIPDAVLNLMPPSWLTAEVISYPDTAEFEVI